MLQTSQTLSFYPQVPFEQKNETFTSPPWCLHERSAQSPRSTADIEWQTCWAGAALSSSAGTLQSADASVNSDAKTQGTPKRNWPATEKLLSGGWLRSLDTSGLSLYPIKDPSLFRMKYRGRHVLMYSPGNRGSVSMFKHETVFLQIIPLICTQDYKQSPWRLYKNYKHDLCRLGSWQMI